MGCFFFLVIDLDVIFFFCFVLCVLITLLGFSKLDFVAGQFSFILHYIAFICYLSFVFFLFLLLRNLVIYLAAHEFFLCLLFLFLHFNYSIVLAAYVLDDFVCMEVQLRMLAQNNYL